MSEEGSAYLLPQLSFVIGTPLIAIFGNYICHFFLPFSSKYNFQEVSVWLVQPLLACCCPTRYPQCDVLLTFDKWKKRRAAVSTLNSQQRVICESESKFCILYEIMHHTVLVTCLFYGSVRYETLWGSCQPGGEIELDMELEPCGFVQDPALHLLCDLAEVIHILDTHFPTGKWAFWNNQLISFLKHNIWISVSCFCTVVKSWPLVLLEEISPWTAGEWRTIPRLPLVAP